MLEFSDGNFLGVIFENVCLGKSWYYSFWVVNLLYICIMYLFFKFFFINFIVKWLNLFYMVGLIVFFKGFLGFYYNSVCW